MSVYIFCIGTGAVSCSRGTQTADGTLIGLVSLDSRANCSCIGSLHICYGGTGQAGVAAHNRQAEVTNTHTRVHFLTYLLLIRNKVM